jgi:heme/copper-type cytochrome/quinol oxidase subunit 2
MRPLKSLRSTLRSVLTSAILLGSGVLALAAAIPFGALGVLPIAARKATGTLEETPVPRMPVIVGRRRRGTPTPTATGLTPPPPTPTPSSPPSTATPTTPSSSPTPTPTAGPIVIRLRAVDWAWQFEGVPGVPDGDSNATLYVGQTYEIHVYNGGLPENVPHIFSGIAALGWSGGPLVVDDPDLVTVIHVTSDMAGTAYPYLCTESSCGVGHDWMTGNIIIP